MATKKTKTTAKKTTAKSSKKSRAAAPRAAAKSGMLPPYGEPIRQAMARGDQAEMRRVAASARKWVRDVQAALDSMEKSMKDLGG